ncbi:hypothetical protein [Methanobrevibacter ruminantium]|uniref:hypothetical protein n=1 Tax=Methanobrevibacter ruminantium TaxID=83816 RepID=UPI003F04A545
MASSFKNKQKIINIILAALILISFQSDQILKLANVYLSPESAAKIGFIVLIISTIVNQLATNKRVYTAEDLTIEKLSTILGKPLQEEIIQQTQATEEEDCYNF